MPHKVVSEFFDKENNNTHYKVGDDYPKDGEPTKKRIEELSKKHPKYKRAFIKEIKTESKSNKKPSSKK